MNYRVFLTFALFIVLFSQAYAGWWQNSASYSYPIDITGTHDALDSNSTIFIDLIDTSAWPCATANSRLALVRQDTNTELDLDITGTCGVSTDLNIVFRMPISLGANEDWNSSDTNGLRMYINDTNRTLDEAKRNRTNAYLEYGNYEDAWHADENTTTKFDGSSDVTFTVQNSRLEVARVAGSNPSKYVTTVSVPDDMNFYIDQDNQQIYGSVFIGRGDYSTGELTTGSIYAHNRADGSGTQWLYEQSVGTIMTPSFDWSARRQHMLTYNSGTNLWEWFTWTSGKKPVSPIGTATKDSDAKKKFGIGAGNSGGHYVYEWWLIETLNQPDYVLGSQLESKYVTADFNAILLANNCLKTDKNLTSVDYDLNDTSVYNVVTANDWVWDENGTSFSSDQNTSRNFTTVGDFNICLTAYADSNSYQDQSCQTISINNCATSRLTIRFHDENTNESLNPNVSIDGNSWNDHVSNGTLDIDLNSWNNGTYSITAWDANHPVRTWQYILDWNAGADFNAALLQGIYGSNIDFNFLDTNDNVLDNAWIEVWIDGLDVNLSSRKQTDSLGQIQFYLNPNDANYVFFITAEDGNTYTYYVTVITVKIPKDEKTRENITDFDVTVGGLGTQDYNGLSADKTFPMLAGTIDYYAITVVDSDGNYLARNYYLRLSSGTSTYEIQPWLLVSGDAISVWIYTREFTTTLTLTDVLIKAKKQISGYGLTEVESRESDMSGSTLFSFYPNDEYRLYFYIGDSLVYTDTLVPSTTEYYAWLPTTAGDWSPTDKEIFNVNFEPAEGIATHSSPFNLEQTIVAEQSTINIINILISSGSTTIKDQNYTGVPDGTTITTSVDPATLASGYPIVVKVTIYSTDGNTTVFTKLYTEWDTAEVNVITLMQNDLKNALCPGDSVCLILILSSIMIVLLVAGVMAMHVTTNPQAIGMVTIILLGIFTYLTWIPWQLFVFAALASALMYLVNQRGVT